MTKQELFDQIAQLLIQYEQGKNNSEVIGCFIYGADFNFLYEFNGEKFEERKNKILTLMSDN